MEEDIQACGVSVRAVHLAARSQYEGTQGLQDRFNRPYTSPLATPVIYVHQILERRRRRQAYWQTIAGTIVTEPVGSMYTPSPTITACVLYPNERAMSAGRSLITALRDYQQPGCLLPSSVDR